MSKDWIERQDHPYDRGYWRRYDEKSRPSDVQGRLGWSNCNRELRDEAEESKAER